MTQLTQPQIDAVAEYLRGKSLYGSAKEFVEDFMPATDRNVDDHSFVPNIDMPKIPWIQVDDEVPAKPNPPKITDLSNCKIWIGDDPDLSKKVQERAFELGWNWGDYNEVRYTESKSLFFTTQKRILTGSGRAMFIEDKATEIFPPQLLKAIMDGNEGMAVDTPIFPDNFGPKLEKSGKYAGETNISDTSWFTNEMKRAGATGIVDGKVEFTVRQNEAFRWKAQNEVTALTESESPKVYILQQDLPDAKAGSKFGQGANSAQYYLNAFHTGTGCNSYSYPASFMENNPAWFKSLDQVWSEADWLLKRHRQGDETPEECIERLQKEIKE